MQTNFDAGQTIVEFSNAFCVKDEKDERVIQCVCCEYSEVDKFCEFFNIVRWLNRQQIKNIIKTIKAKQKTPKTIK